MPWRRPPSRTSCASSTRWTPTWGRSCPGIWRACAAEGDLVSLIDLLTHARAFLWEEFERAAERVVDDGEARRRVLKESHALAADYPAALAQLTRDLFEAEGRTASERARVTRSELVERPLAGHPITGESLGYDLGGDHLAVIAWGDGAQARVSNLGARAGRNTLAVPRPGDVVWGWLGGAPVEENAMRALLAWQRDRDGRLVCGEPGAGIDGFRASHRQALAAHMVALATGERVLRYDDAAALALICRDPAIAADFVARQLRALATTDERHGRLRETLRVYLEHGQSIKRSAALLGLHYETVRRHLEAAEQCLRHPVDERSAEVLLALRLAGPGTAGASLAA